MLLRMMIVVFKVKTKMRVVTLKKKLKVVKLSMTMRMERFG